MQPHPKKRWLIVVLVVLTVGIAGYGAILRTMPFTGSHYSAASETYHSAGGDLALLDALIKNGVALQQVNDRDLSPCQ